MVLAYAPVAQLDRVQDSESWGHRFKSCRVRQSYQRLSFNVLRVKGERPTFCLKRFRLLLLPIGSSPFSELVSWNEALVPTPAFALISDVQFFPARRQVTPARNPASLSKRGCASGKALRGETRYTSIWHGIGCLAGCCSVQRSSYRRIIAGKPACNRLQPDVRQCRHDSLHYRLRQYRHSAFHAPTRFQGSSL